MSPRCGVRQAPGGLGLAAAGVLAAGMLGCFPTVRLGRDDGGSETSTGAMDSGTSAALSSGLDLATTAQVDGPPDTSPEPGTGQGTGIDPDTGMGGPPGSTSDGGSPDTGTVQCEAEPTDNACLTCARESCCAELELCSDQAPCNCFVECLGVGAMPDVTTCQGRCGGSSGVAALEVCLAMACPGTCGTA